MSERTETPPGMRPPVRGRAEGCGWRKTKDHRGGREGRRDGGDSAAEQRAERRGRQHRGRILLPHRPAPPRVPPPPLVPPAPRDPPAAPRGPRGRSAPLRRFARMCRARPPPARPFGAGNDEGPHRGAARRECGAGDSGRSRMGRGAEGGCSPSRSPPRGQRRSPRLQRRCGVGSGLSAAPAPVLRFRPSRSADVTLQPRSVELCVSPCGCVCPRWEMALRQRQTRRVRVSSRRGPRPCPPGAALEMRGALEHPSAPLRAGHDEKKRFKIRASAGRDFASLLREIPAPRQHRVPAGAVRGGVRRCGAVRGRCCAPRGAVRGQRRNCPCIAPITERGWGVGWGGGGPAAP